MVSFNYFKRFLRFVQVKENVHIIYIFLDILAVRIGSGTLKSSLTKLGWDNLFKINSRSSQNLLTDVRS